MRRVLHGDVSAAARVLLAAPVADRAALVARMLREAEAADRYRLATGRAHPLWGSGSLMSAALARPRAHEPYLDEPDYAACMAMVFEALVARAGA
ncbi:DUF7742 family protein [Sinisalibacter lacisalsi]|uniref:DUF7742 domain-containing protein n=1 Tax=Sinisalibacter lacisalsi TaxID=1526570 RepID=A0ABQ1QSZ5_9RHOB|nr:hypothetical protein [Sinisalibacter lacisalsi]GGD40686.1 hypothetical protein GCM10011358_25770 [Sinisalibacter lacisalsi]